MQRAARASTRRSTPTPSRCAAPPRGRSSIAVLPFEDMSAAQDQGFLCDGIAEEVLRALSRIPDLYVASRTSSFQFRHQAADIREIGARLNVDTVLEGSVRRVGDRVRDLGPAGQRRRRLPALVRAVRPRHAGHLRDRGRDRRPDRPRAQGHARRAARTPGAARADAPRLRALPAGPAVLPPAPAQGVRDRAAALLAGDRDQPRATPAPTPASRTATRS